MWPPLSLPPATRHREAQCQQNGMRKAILLHSGGLLLMAGEVHKYFQPKTVAPSQWPDDANAD